MKPRLSLDHYLSRDTADGDWHRFGGQVKTQKIFENNIRGIAEVARSRDEVLLLRTFAYYLSEACERERFYARKLGNRGT